MPLISPAQLVDDLAEHDANHPKWFSGFLTLFSVFLCFILFFGDLVAAAALCRLKCCWRTRLSEFTIYAQWQALQATDTVESESKWHGLGGIVWRD